MKKKRAKRIVSERRVEEGKVKAVHDIKPRSLRQLEDDFKTFTKKFQKDVDEKVKNYRDYVSNFAKLKQNRRSRIAKQTKKQD